eukprot:9944737-Karenia_brevis.AAC.1
MPDPHFRKVLRRRLRLSVCPPGATCHHKRSDGRVCGAPLDPEGHHALTCSGAARNARHNRVRDWVAATHQQCTGAFTETEQHVPQWDR